VDGSDQGSQYSATSFEAFIARNEALQSMSRRGNCYDNAYDESFWNQLKTELLDGGSLAGLKKLGYKSAIISPITTPRAAIRPSAIAPLITPKPNSKLRTNSVRLS
jgi:transposase InsO family protein